MLIAAPTEALAANKVNVLNDTEWNSFIEEIISETIEKKTKNVEIFREMNEDLKTCLNEERLDEEEFIFEFEEVEDKLSYDSLKTIWREVEDLVSNILNKL